MKLTEEYRKSLEELIEMGVVFLIFVIGILIAVGTVCGVIPEMVTVVACIACLGLPFVAGIGILVFGALIGFWEWITETIPKSKGYLIRPSIMRHLIATLIAVAGLAIIGCLGSIGS